MKLYAIVPIICTNIAFSQNILQRSIPFPTSTPIHQINDYAIDNRTFQKKQYESIIKEVENNEKQRQEIRTSIHKDIQEYQTGKTIFSSSTLPGTLAYHRIFEKITAIEQKGYLIREINFDIENAYLDNSLDYNEFERSIKQTGKFLIEKMKELEYDLNSNSAKNYILFQFFTDTISVNSRKHFPFKYDFEDYFGKKDYTKNFVSKLLLTGSGQCHSLPLLYLMLAEEINAEAYLSLSPNHSYIRFPDDNGKMYDIELTNGMFSTPSFILQSGFIKSEAIQNRIYMENLSKDEMLSYHLTDLAAGYIKKFGFDNFADRIITKALELYPNSINANILKAKIESIRFEQTMQRLGIDPFNKISLQNIDKYPNAVKMLEQVNRRFELIDNLGYTAMPDEEYQKWLKSMASEKQIQDNKLISDKFKGILLSGQRKIKK